MLTTTAPPISLQALQAMPLAEWQAVLSGPPEDAARWVGWANYLDLWADRNFWRALRNTLTWTFASLALQFALGLGLALLLGAPGIRTGLEDVAYLSKGVLAPSNAALVEMAVGLAKALGREVATQEQTKELLSLG